jgi:hypothetical protein
MINSRAWIEKYLDQKADPEDKKKVGVNFANLDTPLQESIVMELLTMGRTESSIIYMLKLSLKSYDQILNRLKTQTYQIEHAEGIGKTIPFHIKLLVNQMNFLIERLVNAGEYNKAMDGRSELTKLLREFNLYGKPETAESGLQELLNAFKNKSPGPDKNDETENAVKVQ